MSMPIHHELKRWLEAATQGLPPEVTAYTQKELIEHYQDAVADYREAGMSEAEAHQRVMSDLGEAELASHRFKDAHLGHDRYLGATLASLLNLLALILFPVIYLGMGYDGHHIQAPGLFVVSDIVLFGLSLYILLAFWRLLTWRYDLSGLDWAFRLSIVGLSIQIVADVTGLMWFRYSHNVGAGAGASLYEASSLPEVVVKLFSFFGFLLLGIGLLRIGGRIFKMDDGLYGLGVPLAVTLTAMGACFVSAWVWLNIPPEPVGVLVGVLVALAHLSLWPLLTLLFFRAIYRPPSRPARWA